MRMIRLIAVSICLLSVVTGCDEMKRRWGKSDPPAGNPIPTHESKAIADTVQGVAYVEGMRKTIVRGYGLVVGLVGTGGTDCPDDIRKYLQGEILKRRAGVSTKDL